MVLSGQRPHLWADFAHMQSQPRFLSYKITYQIWLRYLNYFLNFSVRRQTDRHTHTDTDTQTDDMPKMNFSGSVTLKTWRSIKISRSIFWTNAILYQESKKECFVCNKVRDKKGDRQFVLVATKNFQNSIWAKTK